MKEIQLTRGKVAIVDDADFERVSKYKWCALKRGNAWYALRTVRGRGKQRSEYLPRFLLKPKKGQEVDHINGDGLDNRGRNLRICSHAENQHNSRKRKDGITSRYKGVSWYKKYRKYVAQIMENGCKRNLGYFKTEIQAAFAYDRAARKYFSEFAKLNFPIRLFKCKK